VSVGEKPAGVYCQNLESLTFDAHAFDLVITSDVMEHVGNPIQAFAEIGRVLAPGGAHVWSVPLEWPLLQRTVTRARSERGGIVYLEQPRYHSSGVGEPSLVFNDFGRDLIEICERLGMRAWFFRPHAAIAKLNRNACVISMKPQSP
jgi:SAM-dependent methyltransferase